MAHRKNEEFTKEEGIFYLVMAGLFIIFTGIAYLIVR